MASEEQADKLMKKAEKKVAPSLLSLRFRPEWDEAAPLFENAALQYKLAGCPAKAMAAYEKAAHANERGGGTGWHAAKHLETAAGLAKDLGKWDALYDYIEQAASLYVEVGKISVGAETCSRGARMLEQADPAKASALYMRAVDLYESDAHGSSAREAVQRAVGLHVSGRRWDAACEVLLRWAVVCNDSENTLALCRAYLSVIVIWLHAGDAEQAWQSYQDVLDVPAFSESGEAFAAEEVLNAYATGDAGVVQQKIKGRQEFQGLDAQVARLAKALPSEHHLPAMAKVLASKLELKDAGELIGADLPETGDGDVDLT